MIVAFGIYLAVATALLISGMISDAYANRSRLIERSVVRGIASLFWPGLLVGLLWERRYQTGE